MSTTSAMEIGSDRWNAQMYAGLSLASEMAASLERPKRMALSLFRVWTAYRRLDWLNQSLENLLDAIDCSAQTPPVASPEDYRSVRDLFLRLYEPCVRILSHRDEFPQGGLMRKKLARLEAHSERLLDVADWFDALSTPEVTAAKFDAALAELNAGQVLPAAALR